MQYAQFVLGVLPLSLRCYENGQISIHRLLDFPTFVDQPEQGLQGVFDGDGATIGTTDIQYGEMIDLDESPQVKAWLEVQDKFQMKGY